MHSSLHLVLHT
ncbi:hypothetical protein F383_13627 [Gossypium arboreum]|uniref:Uncharacterized protein n=1 Tax=Gossypium arboreum TaxID=29729 RepID=A0A0B0MIW6_GOSAR|nr:hypothetical protein F383_38064 [Gossypium arboreum]KHG27603.1 hypothetical protein F383_13627 [Gossypium arboreum]